MKKFSSYRELDSDDLDIDICHTCGSIYKFGNAIVNEKKSVYIVTYGTEGLPLPNLNTDKDISLMAYTEKETNHLSKELIYRMYTKNILYTGDYVATHIWIGDYISKLDNGQAFSFEDFANDSHGVKRLGVLRADVDNLGSTFINAFQGSTNSKLTLSRMATLSRQLSLFFKYYINHIAKMHLNDEAEAEISAYRLWDKDNTSRHVGIVYSGGDDLFLVGAWDEIIGFSIDLYKAFNRLTGGHLSFSAGIAMTSDKIPVRVMADLAGKYEDASKKQEGKNSITLFQEFMDDSHKNVDDPYMHTFNWDQFINGVMEEKVEFLKPYVKDVEGISGAFRVGKGQLYKLVELLRIALGIRITDKTDSYKGHFLYWLARLEPQGKVAESIELSYIKFKETLYGWFMNDTDNINKKQLLTAILILVYGYRDR